MHACRKLLAFSPVQENLCLLRWPRALCQWLHSSVSKTAIAVRAMMSCGGCRCHALTALVPPSVRYLHLAGMACEDGPTMAWSCAGRRSSE